LYNARAAASPPGPPPMITTSNTFAVSSMAVY
jgi:hypothetical protein